jgi:hypothetical protein
MASQAHGAERKSMMKRNPARMHISLLLILATMVSACAGAQPRAVQVAHVQAQVVEAASDSFAKLYLDDAISRDVYLRGRAAYGKWAEGQAVLAKSLAEWKRVGDAGSKERFSAALMAAMKLSGEYLAFIGQFVDLGAVKAKVEGR